MESLAATASAGCRVLDGAVMLKSFRPSVLAGAERRRPLLEQGLCHVGVLVASHAAARLRKSRECLHLNELQGLVRGSSAVERPGRRRESGSFVRSQPTLIAEKTASQKKWRKLDTWPRHQRPGVSTGTAHLRPRRSRSGTRGSGESRESRLSPGFCPAHARCQPGWRSPAHRDASRSLRSTLSAGRPGCGPRRGRGPPRRGR